MPPDRSSAPFAPNPAWIAIATRVGLARDGRYSISRLLLAAAALTWLPLLLLSTVGEQAGDVSTTRALLQDHLTVGRYLVAIPLLIWLGFVLDPATQICIIRLRSARLLQEADVDAFERILARTVRLANHRVVHTVMAVVALCGSIAAVPMMQTFNPSTWRLDPHSPVLGLGAAGLWDLAIAAPLVRFLFLAAMWKLALWTCLLVSLSRRRLRIDALHPDGHAGLRFLSDTQLAFTPLIAAIAVQFGATISMTIRNTSLPASSFKVTAVAFVAICVLLLLWPLALFIRRTFQARAQACLAFGVWGLFAARHLSSTALRMNHSDDFTGLNAQEFSILTDAASLYDRVEATRLVPVSRCNLLVILLATIVPMLLPMVTQLPMKEILARLAAVVL